MPPRSYYLDPRLNDYIAYADAFFEDEVDSVKSFGQNNNLPFIDSEKHIAGYMGISPLLIRQILHNPRYHYRYFRIPKRHGGWRDVCSPKTYLKVIQWWIASNIFNTIEIHESVHGFVKGRSFVTNAQCHLGAKHILNVDIKRFFPSIKRDMVFGLLQGLGYPENGANLLASLTTLGGVAPTGAPTSPAIGNILLREFDGKMDDYAKNQNTRYTRYADDLTFSSSERIEDKFLKYVDDLVQEYGFVLNKDKTKFMGNGQRMEVTGLVINEKIQLPREWRNRARAILHSAAISQKVDKKLIDNISGIFGVLKAVDPEEKLRITLDAKKIYERMRLI